MFLTIFMHFRTVLDKTIDILMGYKLLICSKIPFENLISKCKSKIEREGFTFPANITTVGTYTLCRATGTKKIILKMQNCA